MTNSKPLYQLHPSVLQLITTTTVLYAILSAPVMARSLYELTISSGGVTVSKGFSDVDSFINQLDNNALQALLPRTAADSCGGLTA